MGIEIRAPKRPSKQLSYEDAVLIHILHRRGEFQHRIAAFFDVNQGRINEVLNGHLFPEAINDPRLL